MSSDSAVDKWFDDADNDDVNKLERFPTRQGGKAGAGLGIESLKKVDLKRDQDTRKGDGKRLKKREISYNSDEDTGMELTRGGKAFGPEPSDAPSGQKKSPKKRRKDGEAAAATSTKHSPKQSLGLAATQRQADEENHAASVSVERDDVDAVPFKRKRKKKRSKQKNIVKDKRSVKPVHLIVGSDSYRGRELTDETKEKLGMAVASDVAWSLDTAADK